MSKAREQLYLTVIKRIESLIAEETDDIAIFASVVCELHHAFDYFHWTGFYRVVAPETLKIGPYQGSHGCLTIPFSRGVCGKAAREKKVQRVANVDTFPGHIACSATTRSEIVVPVLNSTGLLKAVLDIDSDFPNSFSAIDERYLINICTQIGARLS